MAGIFCSSEVHVSQNCDIYSSNESRKKVAKSKKLCQLCLEAGHLAKNCLTTTHKCYSCFITDHVTAFCPQRVRACEMFLPKIDQVLISRFMECLWAEELFSLTVSSKKAAEIFMQNNALPFNLEVKKKVSASYFEKERYSVYKKHFIYVAIYDFRLSYFPTHQKLLLKNVICRAKKVSISYSTFSAQEFLCLISAETLKLVCLDVKFSTPIKFEHLLSQIPNIRNLDLQKCEIDIPDSWPKELMKNITGKQFKRLRIETENFEVDFGTLVKFIKKKRVKPSDVSITINICTAKENKEKLQSNILRFFDISTVHYSTLIINLCQNIHNNPRKNYNTLGRYIIKPIIRIPYLDVIREFIYSFTHRGWEWIPRPDSPY